MIHTLIFTAYILFYWNSGVKSISMTAYESKYSWVGFYLFMATIAGFFLAGEPGQLFFGVGSFYIAGAFLIAAGVTHRFQKKLVKNLHHAVSTIAICFGFYAVGSWLVVGLFALSLVPAYLYGRSRFLWWLEISAFYLIKIFTF